MIHKYELLRLNKNDFKDLESKMIKEMLATGMSMGFMSSLVNIGSLTLQTAINKLGQEIIVAHTAARKITEIYMIMFSGLWPDDGNILWSEYGSWESLTELRKV